MGVIKLLDIEMVYKQHRHILLGLSLFLLLACQREALPTIGRTNGDFPMSKLLTQQDDCWTFSQRVYFDSSFATGMSFSPEDCLSNERKIGRKTVAEIAQMHVSLTYDGQYYIIKNGY
ncbi:hypothetical protein [Alteromonas flava]|uniref:hypothetical protein n=1 Tax=Alteromonas flava TaxID=2048003 RepID=UPI000C28D684|nr:hypothetical protein [Alteromonas flava]